MVGGFYEYNIGAFCPQGGASTLSYFQGCGVPDSQGYGEGHGQGTAPYLTSTVPNKYQFTPRNGNFFSF